MLLLLLYYKLKYNWIFLIDPSQKCKYIVTFRAAICCIGAMYEKLGRMMGRSYEETVQILIKCLRNAESQTRIEIMITLEKVSAAGSHPIDRMK